jgi:hypothetical protein
VEDKLKKDQSKKDEGTQLTKEWVEKSGQLVHELEKYVAPFPQCVFVTSCVGTGMRRCAWID